jgi:hypothetical protein
MDAETGKVAVDDIAERVQHVQAPAATASGEQRGGRGSDQQHQTSAHLESRDLYC